MEKSDSSRSIKPTEAEWREAHFKRFSERILQVGFALKEQVTEARRSVRKGQYGSWELFSILANVSDILKTMSSAVIGLDEDDHPHQSSSTAMDDNESTLTEDDLVPGTPEWKDYFRRFSLQMSSNGSDIQKAVDDVKAATGLQNPVLGIFENVADILENVSALMEEKIESLTGSCEITNAPSGQLSTADDTLNAPGAKVSSSSGTNVATPKTHAISDTEPKMDTNKKETIPGKLLGAGDTSNALVPQSASESTGGKRAAARGSGSEPKVKSSKVEGGGDHSADSNALTPVPPLSALASACLHSALGSIPTGGLYLSPTDDNASDSSSVSYHAILDEEDMQSVDDDDSEMDESEQPVAPNASPAEMWIPVPHTTGKPRSSSISKPVLNISSTSMLGGEEGSATRSSSFHTSPVTPVSCIVHGHSISYSSDQPITLQVIGNRILVSYTDPDISIAQAYRPFQLSRVDGGLQAQMGGVRVILQPKEGTSLNHISVTLTGGRELEFTVPALSE